ncbi:amino acid permease-associated region [Thermodesulfatator indicus DSM 15286]|uniref:Amino acid permease-associated region n=1 Tax=Thermodesulfatator indicus (strain DSM 15286 / JCM 11887 / CIR29812) TaxID=667014 RepID=F8AD76_THEID|nr:APC family permease [Thermodesulfatator indicus]AEH44808.1 amino acid permease-associated region [Thermodesulfatator indicus DSM 15286]
MQSKNIGFWEAYSIGVGGMIGGGIFAVLGLTVLLAKGAAPLAFLFAGLLALITAYSYAKLSVRFPSEGGTIEFVVRGFGSGLFAAWLNTLLLASYIIMLSLYSYAFGSYGAVLIAGVETLWLKKLLTAGVIIFFTILNLLGAYIVGKAEDLMVAFKVLILLFFSILGFFTIEPSRLSPETYPHVLNILTGGLIIFLAYEGFELIANTAQDVSDPEKVLPKAFYAAVASVICIYVLVAIVAVGNLDPAEVVKAKDYVLAEAAKPFLGKLGFVLISIAALASTASAINATLYGTARVSYLVAKYGELPQFFARRIWKGAYEGAIIISALTVVAALSFDLKNISVAGSLGFLLVFSAVNFANFRLYRQTKANRFLAALGGIGCLISAVVLVVHNFKTSPHALYSSAWVLGGALIFELCYRLISKRRLKDFIDWRLREREEFLEGVDRYMNLILAAVKKHFKEAEVYLLDEIAEGYRESANKLHLLLALPEPLPKEEEPKIEELIRVTAGLSPHHPLKISTVASHELREYLREKSHKLLTDGMEKNKS